MSRRKWAGVIAAVFAAIAITLPATAAFAGSNPTDSPTVAPAFGYNPSPTPPPIVRAAFWQWDVQQSQIGLVNVNNVEGTGAIPMAAWINTNLSPTLDRFSLLGNSVTLKHTPLPLPDVNLATCTVTFNQPDGFFRIVAGTGTGANLRSQNGQFDLEGLISFPERVKIKYGRPITFCPLQFVSPGFLLFFISRNLPVPGLPRPTFVDFSVQGSATVFSIIPPPVPTPTPTTPYPTPTVTYTTPAPTPSY